MRSYIRRRGDVAAAEMARDRAQSRQHQLDIKVKPTGQHLYGCDCLDGLRHGNRRQLCREGLRHRSKDDGIIVEIVNAISAAVQRSIQFFHLPVSPTGRFNGGFNTGVRGGYEWGP